MKPATQNEDVIPDRLALSHLKLYIMLKRGQRALCCCLIKSPAVKDTTRRLADHKSVLNKVCGLSYGEHSAFKLFKQVLRGLAFQTLSSHVTHVHCYEKLNFMKTWPKYQPSQVAEIQ